MTHVHGTEDRQPPPPEDPRPVGTRFDPTPNSDLHHDCPVNPEGPVGQTGWTHPVSSTTCRNVEVDRTSPQSETKSDTGDWVSSVSLTAPLRLGWFNRHRTHQPPQSKVLPRCRSVDEKVGNDETRDSSSTVAGGPGVEIRSQPHDEQVRGDCPDPSAQLRRIEPTQAY